MKLKLGVDIGAERGHCGRRLTINPIAQKGEQRGDVDGAQVYGQRGAID
ncbi:MAG: hypothetical protein M3081_16625 [Gemmatimonadota bacterium]|nr:hypothetical protein [Gemmatimonadota bacterium]